MLDIHRLIGLRKEEVLLLAADRGYTLSLSIGGRTKEILLNSTFFLPQLFKAVGTSEGTAAPLHLTFTLTIYSIVSTLKRKESLSTKHLVLGSFTCLKASLPVSVFQPFFFVRHHRGNLLQCRKQFAVECTLGTLVLAVVPKSRLCTLTMGHPVSNSRVVHSVLHVRSLQESIMGVPRERRALKRESVSMRGC